MSSDTCQRISGCTSEAWLVYFRFKQGHQLNKSSVILGNFSTRKQNVLTIGTTTPNTTNSNLPALDDPNGLRLADFDLQEQDTIFSTTLQLEALGACIDVHAERAAQQSDSGQFDLAEASLLRAIQYSQQRESCYGVIFTDRIGMTNELATTYQKQGRYEEAAELLGSFLRQPIVSTSQELENEIRAGLKQAKEIACVASTCYESLFSYTRTTSNFSLDDINRAKRYARETFRKLFACRFPLKILCKNSRS